MSANILDHRWKVSDSDFATRVTIPDLRGFFEKLPFLPSVNKSKSIVIEPGTRSVIIEEGFVVGELYAGEYTLESIIDRLKFWKNKQSTVFLTRAEEVSVDSAVKNLPCIEGVCFDVQCRWTVQTTNVLLFMENLMGANENVSVNQLEQWLAPSLHQAIRDTVGQMEYSFLTGNNILKDLADGIRSRVEVKYSRYGLVFVDLQSVQVTPQDGGLAEKKGEQWLAARENQLQRAANELDNEKVRINAEDMRQKVDLRVSLRALVSEDNLNQIKSREDFEKSIDQIDRQKLLRLEEREQLIAAYEERKEDHADLRQHLLSTLELQREQEIEELRLAVDHAVRMKSLGQEIEQARLVRTADSEQWRSELEQERESAEHRRQQQSEDVKARWNRLREARRQKRDDSWESLLHAQRSETIKAELDLSRANRQRQVAIVQAELESRLAHEKLETQKRQDLWEIEAREKKSGSQLDRLQRIQEMNAQFAEKQQRLQLEMENLKADSASKRELERIQAMSGLGTDVLIATAGQANAALLADLKKHQATQDAVKVQATANPSAELNAERLKMYEQMNATERAKADAIAEAYKMAMQAQQASVHQMIGGLAQAATPTHYGNPGYSNAAHQPGPPSKFSPPPPMPTADVWHYSIQGQASPPLNWAQFQHAIQTGQVNATTMVWKTGMPAWVAAAQVPELVAYFRQNTPPPMPGPPGPPPV
jgi:arsenate reductase-like glutaredoxin family protein